MGNAVGMSVAANMAEARFNTAEHKIFDQHVVGLCGDGGMQEGVASEACALAGVWGLDNLIFIYDSNDVTLDAPANYAVRGHGKTDESVRLGRPGNRRPGHAAVSRRVRRRETPRKRQPQFIIAHTLIGKGIPEVAGTYKAHGEAGAKFVDAARKALGLPDEHFFVSKDVYDYFAAQKDLLAEYRSLGKNLRRVAPKNPDKAKLLDDGLARKVPPDLLSKIPEFPTDAKLATRKAGGEVLQPIAQAMPLLIGGSADLYGSTMNYIKDGGDFNAIIAADATSVSAFASTACARFSTASRITGCSAPRVRRSGVYRLLPRAIRLTALAKLAQRLHFHARLDRRRRRRSDA